MVDKVSTAERQLDRVFAALADGSRRRMLSELRERSLSISELAEPFRMSFAGVAKHVEVLERAGLVRKIRAPDDGRVFRLELQDQTLREASEWLRYHQEFWNQKLDQLEAFVGNECNARTKTKNRKKD